MIVLIGVAKTPKYALGVSGDSVEVSERPAGGVSCVIVDGQGSGAAAKRISQQIANRITALVGAGTRDGAAVRAGGDYLYAWRGGKVSAALTLLSVDVQDKSLIISRNTDAPVVVLEGGSFSLVSEEVHPVGVHYLPRPSVTKLPLSGQPTAVLAFSDGACQALSKQGPLVDVIKQVCPDLPEDDDTAQQMAQRLLAEAINADDNRPRDDMTVVIMAVLPVRRRPAVTKMSVSYPV